MRDRKGERERKTEREKGREREVDKIIKNRKIT